MHRRSMSASSGTDASQSGGRAWTPALSVAASVLVILTGVGADVVFSACAGYSPSPSEPSPPDRLVTVTIRATGIDPREITGTPATLEFVNLDSVVHDIRSNPHPDHTRCPTLNLGTIPPGQRVAILDAFPSGTSCTYHDETRPDDPLFQGSIVIR